MSPPTEPAPTEKRLRIEEAALEIFAEKGFSGTRTSEIAKRAGVAEGTIFRHFPSKQALLMGVLTAVVEKVIAPMATKTFLTLLDKEHLTLASFLEDIIEDRLGLLEKSPPGLRVFLQEAPLKPEVREMLEAVFTDRVYPPFVEKIQRLKAAGHIATDLTDALIIRTLMSQVGVYGWLSLVLYTDREWQHDEERRMLVEVLCRAFSPKTP